VRVLSCQKASQRRPRFLRTPLLHATKVVDFRESAAHEPLGSVASFPNPKRSASAGRDMDSCILPFLLERARVPTSLLYPAERACDRSPGPGLELSMMCLFSLGPFLFLPLLRPVSRYVLWICPSTLELADRLGLSYDSFLFSLIPAIDSSFRWCVLYHGVRNLSFHFRLLLCAAPHNLFSIL